MPRLQMVIDAKDFARAGRVLEGSVPVAEFERLCQGAAESQDGQIQWRLSGRMDAQDRAWLFLQAQGDIVLICQRCLEPFRHGLDVSNTLGLADDAGQLEALDALQDEEGHAEVEYLVAESAMDVLALVEDELILALPYVPRHDVCPRGSSSSETGGDAPASPFAVLKRLGKS